MNYAYEQSFMLCVEIRTKEVRASGKLWKDLILNSSFYKSGDCGQGV